jgi:hypothetical protein
MLLTTTKTWVCRRDCCDANANGTIRAYSLRSGRVSMTEYGVYSVIKYQTGSIMMKVRATMRTLRSEDTMTMSFFMQKDGRQLPTVFGWCPSSRSPRLIMVVMATLQMSESTTNVFLPSLKLIRHHRSRGRK